MDINELMKLVNAGFTKAEILAITGNGLPTDTQSEPTEVTEITDTVNTPVSNTERTTEVRSDVSQSTPQTTNVNFAPMMSDAQIEKLAQMLNRGSASIDLPQQKNVSEVLGEHFVDLMNGK